MSQTRLGMLMLVGRQSGARGRTLRAQYLRRLLLSLATELSVPARLQSAYDCAQLLLAARAGERPAGALRARLRGLLDQRLPATAPRTDRLWRAVIEASCGSTLLSLDEALVATALMPDWSWNRLARLWDELLDRDLRRKRAYPD